MLRMKKKLPEEAWYYMARAHHHRHEFELAAIAYKTYLKGANEKSEYYPLAEQYLEQCFYAPALLMNKSSALVVRFDETINSSYAEYAPKLHPRNENQLYFTSDRTERNNADIWRLKFEGESWIIETPLSGRYNSDGQDELMGFYDNGYQIVYGRQAGDKVNVYKDNWDERGYALEFSFMEGVLEQVPDAHDFYFFSDSIIFFTGNRPEANYGNSDLYYIVQVGNDKWSNAFNLGAVVNSPYNERCPYLAPDGRTLYFSTNRPQNIGGYDIYKTYYNDTLGWQTPELLGYPINSAGDDLYYTLAPDGKKSLFFFGTIWR